MGPSPSLPSWRQRGTMGCEGLSASFPGPFPADGPPPPPTLPPGSCLLGASSEGDATKTGEDTGQLVPAQRAPLSTPGPLPHWVSVKGWSWWRGGVSGGRRTEDRSPDTAPVATFQPCLSVQNLLPPQAQADSEYPAPALASLRERGLQRGSKTLGTMALWCTEAHLGLGRVWLMAVRDLREIGMGGK